MSFRSLLFEHVVFSCISIYGTFVSQTPSTVFNWSYLNKPHSVDVHNIICVSPDQRVSELCPLLKLLHIHNRKRLCLNVLAYLLWQRGDRGYIYPMNDSSNFCLTFQNSYLQFTTCVWAVWKCIMGIMGLPKQLKCRSFRGPCIVFRFSSFGNFHPCWSGLITYLTKQCIEKISKLWLKSWNM